GAPAFGRAAAFWGAAAAAGGALTGWLYSRSVSAVVVVVIAVQAVALVVLPVLRRLDGPTLTPAHPPHGR
ncbi:MAG: hypothetical protein SW019_25775, partial [Actinomycetota bacterium]|nr:hypothetical protein [Actinomycetota bacterium]